jgi:hypothetical protein
MLRHIASLGLLGLFISLIGVLPTSAQLDSCLDYMVAFNYGDTADGEVNNVNPIASYCFEGQKGDEIVVQAEGTSGDLAIFLVLTGLDAADFYEQAISEEDAVTLEYILPTDNFYVVSVAGREGTEGEFTISLQTRNEEVLPTAEATIQATAVSAPAPDVDAEATEIAVPPASEASTACIAGAYIVVPGHVAEFFINTQSITQVYCLYAQAGTEYSITVESVQSTLDPMVMVYTSDFETVLAANNNASDGQTQAHTEFTAAETAMYPIVIARAGFNTGVTEGIYRMTVDNLSTSEAETCPAVFQIPENGISIAAMPQDGLHAFCIDGEEGLEITLNAEAKSGNLAMTVYIIEPNWDTVGDMTSMQKTLEITAALEKDQPYFLLVFDDTGAGGFDLTLTKK